MPWTTPGTATAGDVLTAAFWNTQVRDNLAEFSSMFAAWTSYTPQIDQGATTNVAKGVTYARYLKVGRLAVVAVRLDITGTGTASTQMTCTLPSAIVPVSQGAQGSTLGNGTYYDASATTTYNVNVRASSTTQVSFLSDATANSFFGAVPNVPFGNGDYLTFFFICETTS